MSAEKDLAKAIGAHLREKKPAADPRWPALARGELSTEEAAALRNEAKAEARAEDLDEAFRPLDEAERDELASALLAKVGRKEPKRSRRPAIVLLAAAAALAFAVAIILSRGEPAALPMYVAEVQLDATARSTSEPSKPLPGKPVEARAGSEIRLSLRPETKVEGPISARVFVVTPRGAKPWAAATVEGKPNGGIFVKGSVDEARRLAGSDGFAIAAVVGAEGTLPNEKGLEALVVADGLPSSVRVVKVDVEVRDAP